MLTPISQSKIAVIGLGYVGLPLLKLISEKTKFSVIGFDIDHLKIKSLKKNKSYLSDITNRDIKKIKYTITHEQITDFDLCLYINVMYIQ